MWRCCLIFLWVLSGCGGVAWNTTLADHPSVRAAMVASVVPGVTTETAMKTRWGNPTQLVREGAETRFIYRNMTNPKGYYAPQFGNSADYVVVVFQYRLAVEAYSSETEGCRATFAPRPPGPGFDNPSTVNPVNCGVTSPAAPGLFSNMGGGGEDAATSITTTDGRPGVPSDTHAGSKGKL